MGSKPEREDETPSAGINWKLFLLVAGIIGAVFFAGMAMQSDGDSISSTVDADSPNIDIGQGSGPNNPPVAVETETGELEPEGRGEVGKTGIYYPIDSLPSEIASQKNLKVKIVNPRIEGDVLKFSFKNTNPAAGEINSADCRISGIIYYQEELCTMSFGNKRERTRGYEDKKVEVTLRPLGCERLDIRELRFWF